MANTKDDRHNTFGSSWAALWRLLTSIRISLLLFGILAAVFLLGILIPQGESSDLYSHNYGDLMGSLITFLDLDQIFSSTWFFVLCLLFFVNLLACTINRWQIFYHRVKRTRLVESESPPSLSAKLHFLGSPFIHTGLLLVLLGAFIGAFYSSEQHYEIPVPGSQAITLKDHIYELKVTGFDVDYHADGSPSQYRTQVKLVENGKDVHEKTISVNNPLSYQGFKVYQFTYGWLLDLSLEKNGSSRNIQVKDGDLLALNEGGSDNLHIRFYPDWARDEDGHPVSRTPQPNNPRLVYLQTVDGLPIDMGMLKSQEGVELADGLKITFTGYRNYTGLHVKRDPGVPIVFTGFIFFGSGIPLHYLFSGKRRRKGD
jgi:cytochrome c biogenesis protein